MNILTYKYNEVKRMTRHNQLNPIDKSAAPEVSKHIDINKVVDTPVAENNKVSSTPKALGHKKLAEQSKPSKPTVASTKSTNNDNSPSIVDV